jgi:hypothetical protein
VAQLDRLLTALTSARADSVELLEGDAATLVTAGVRRPVTRQTLNAAQLVGFIREIAPSDAAACLDAILPSASRTRAPRAPSPCARRTTAPAGPPR